MNETLTGQEPVAVCLKSTRDGSYGEPVVFTAYAMFDKNLARAKEHPWIVRGAGTLVPLYAAPRPAQYATDEERDYFVAGITAHMGTPAQERGIPLEYVAAAQAVLKTPPNPANIITKHKDETGYSVYEAWARRCATAIIKYAAPQLAQDCVMVPRTDLEKFGQIEGKYNQ